jgi:2-phospho-L-lactate guanylyltransferase
MIVAVVPVKELRAAKSRLSAYVTDPERERLVVTMAARAVNTIRETGLVAEVRVATPDPRVAAALNAGHIADAGSLNATIRATARWAQSRCASGLLILPGDLPTVTTSDVTAMVVQGSGVTIASTHDGGTGALYLAPPRSIPPEFGEGSYARHILSARQRGVLVHEVDRPGLRHDVDTIEDLRRFSHLLRAG